MIDLGLDEQIAAVEIDLAQAERRRQEEVIFAHRLLLLYRQGASRAKYPPAPAARPACSRQARIILPQAARSGQSDR